MSTLSFPILNYNCCPLMANGGKTYSLSFIVFIKLLMIWFYLSMGGVI